MSAQTGPADPNWPEIARVFSVLMDDMRKVFGEVGGQMRKALDAIQEFVETFDLLHLLRRTAIERAGIPESDIRSIDPVAKTVRLWNHRVIDLEPYL